MANPGIAKNYKYRRLGRELEAMLQSMLGHSDRGYVQSRGSNGRLRVRPEKVCNFFAFDIYFACYEGDASVIRVSCADIAGGHVFARGDVLIAGDSFDPDSLRKFVTCYALRYVSGSNLSLILPRPLSEGRMEVVRLQQEQCGAPSYAQQVAWRKGRKEIDLHLSLGG